MSNKKEVVQFKVVEEMPTGPDEVNILEAIGLIPQLVGQESQEALENRLRIHDPIVRVHSLIKLITSPNFSSRKVNLIMHISQRSAYVRSLLHPIFLDKFKFDLVAKLQKFESDAAESNSELTRQLMTAQYNCDYVSQIELLGKLYFQTGNEYYLEQIKNTAKDRLPWQASLVHLLRQLFIASPDQVQAVLLSLTSMLEQADAQQEFKLLTKYILKLKNCSYVQSYCVAQLKFWEKDYQGCLDYLDKSNLLTLAKEQSAGVNNLAAKCYEKVKDFKSAAIWWDEQNKVLAKTNEFSLKDYLDGVDKRASLPVPIKKAPSRFDRYFIMCGFPRSGTTLLENALNAHPKIATCEETSSLLGATRAAFGTPLEKDPEIVDFDYRLKLFLELYYTNLNRHVNKADPDVIIDKTPIISSNIKYMEKVFPDKKYIFSIRHPFDVVLSNLKQTYSQNAAMAAFNDLQESCILYNRVMSDWFDVFSGEDERVQYIRYDDLVNNFETEIGDALKFLGVDWADEVLNFVEHSKSRAVRTPSYRNVRKGLTIGVQTSWQNYDFLFTAECRKLLDPWVERFGYQS